MNTLRFSPELFEHRNEVVAALSEAGFDWLSHYSNVDPLHDVFGIEVCGIRERADAVAILTLLLKKYPGWIPGCLCYKDYGRDPGWQAKVHRDPEPPDETWETAS